MESQYAIQIVHKPSGEVVVGWAPGKTDELDLITDLALRVAAKGVGVFRTEAHVKADVIAAFRELLLDRKKQV